MGHVKFVFEVVGKSKAVKLHTYWSGTKDPAQGPNRKESVPHIQLLHLGPLAKDPEQN